METFKMSRVFPLIFRGVRNIASSNQAPGLVDKTLNDDKLAPPSDIGAIGGIRKNRSWASLSRPQDKPLTIDVESIKKSVASIKLPKEDKDEALVDKLFLNTLQVFKEVQSAFTIPPIDENNVKFENLKKSVPEIKILSPKTEVDEQKLEKKVLDESQKEEIINELAKTKVEDVKTEKNVIPPDKITLEKARAHLDTKKSDKVTKEALFKAAVHYEKKGNYEKALLCYVKAGKLRCKESYFRASLICEWGKGSVKVDKEVADKYLSLAAILGHRIARHNIAAKLLSKNHTPLTEEVLAVFYLQQNIEQGVAKSMNFLAHRLLTKNKNAEDLKQAVEYLTAAAEQNYAPSLYNLAICYLNGTGVSKPDKRRAYEMLVKASKLNHVSSINKLADMVEKGDDNCGITRDQAEAARLREQALHLDEKMWRKNLMNVAFESAGYKHIIAVD